MTDKPKKYYPILNLQTIRDYILQNYPNLKWWDGINKYETWTEGRNYLHRQGMPNEIRIEIDGEDKIDNWLQINLIGIELLKKKIDFAIYYVEGGRSPHIHIYNIDELDNLTYEERTKYREMFLKEVCPKGIKIDYELCEEKHLCALEFVNHFKYNKPKQLLYYFFTAPLTNQGIDYDLKRKAEEPIKIIKSKKKSKLIGDNPKETLRNRILSKLNFEEVFKKYNVQYKGKKAICPFHADKDPSLSFSNDKGLWNCFSCHEKGDIISLIQKLEEKNAKR